MPYSAQELQREIGNVARQLLNPGADSKYVRNAIGNLIPMVQESNPPDRDTLVSVIAGAITHLDWGAVFSARVLLELAARMVAARS